MPLGADPKILKLVLKWQIKWQIKTGCGKGGEPDGWEVVVEGTSRKLSCTAHMNSPAHTRGVCQGCLKNLKIPDIISISLRHLGKERTETYI